MMDSLRTGTDRVKETIPGRITVIIRANGLLIR